jgi:hypothetical protein
MEVSGSKPMIDTVLNLLFNCPHRHLTRPFTPISKSGIAHSETYVVCLDCAKQFPYDLNTMRMGEAIVHSHDHYVVLPKMPRSRKTKVGYALGIGVPLAVLIGSMFAGRKPKQRGKADDRAGRL